MTGPARDEVELLERSLAEARREHAAGELDDAALARIEEADGARLTAARARLDAEAAAPGADVPVTRGPRLRRGHLLVVAAVSLAVAGALVAVAVANPFAASGRPAPLSRAGKVAALLAAGEVEVSVGTPAATLRALSLFDAALRLDPRDAEAIVESAWLRFLAGEQRHDAAWERSGAAALARAAASLPRNAAAHLDDGIVLLRYDHEPAAARAQLLRAGELPETPSEQYYTEFYLALATG